MSEKPVEPGVVMVSLLEVRGKQFVGLDDLLLYLYEHTDEKLDRIKLIKQLKRLKE